jgi:amino acid transporter
MARFYAQICTVAFLIVTIGGFFVGNATQVAHGQAQGNVDGMQLHLTYARDILDVVLLAAFAFVGFVAGRRLGRIVTGVAGVVLLALAILGILFVDTNTGARSIAGLHFTLAINIFDLVVGALAVLAALGTVEDEAPTSIIRPSA